ncbi:MAG: TIGR04222 domain-containing membrane protein [Acidobacteriia bacterium]|nr:TIGR04222 domain-containing membrane protein [Terriglobia bacterium]
MNPFDLRGPEFLLFYSILVIVTLLTLHWLRMRHESGPQPLLSLQDPYLLACLSGGRESVVRVALVALMDRGLLQVAEDRKVSKGPHWGEKSGQNPLENDLLRVAQQQRELHDLFADRALLEDARPYEETLQNYHLLPAAEEQNFRRKRMLIGLLVLVGTSILKIMIALSRGRTNIGFLIILTVIAVIATYKVSMPWRTRLGDEYLKSVRAVFSDVRGRAATVKPGGATNELMWLAALFGLAVLPASAFPFVQYFRPVRAAGAGSTCGSGCGSSGGDGGGSCGGGCGGGCGGCGG